MILLNLKLFIIKNKSITCLKIFLIIIVNKNNKQSL